jgi:hypothetical protein
MSYLERYKLGVGHDPIPPEKTKKDPIAITIEVLEIIERLRLHMSPFAMGKAIGRSKNYIYRVINGEFRPPLDVLLKLRELDEKT